MKIRLLLVGKTTFNYVSEGFNDYFNRINKYYPFELDIISDIKKSSNTPIEVIKKKEGELILKKIRLQDFNILLDEKGKTYSSTEFSKYVEHQMMLSYKTITFIIGGAYGFSGEVYKAVSAKFSLSKLTFSHQLVRLLFVEQLYRAITIMKNEPYHHQ